MTTSLQEPTDAVFVNEGDACMWVQVLARLNTADLSASANQASAHLEQSQYQADSRTRSRRPAGSLCASRLGSGKAKISRWRRSTLSRDEQLLGQGFISQQDVDTQRTQVEVYQKARRRSAGGACASHQKTSKPTARKAKACRRRTSIKHRPRLQQVQAQIGRAQIVSPVNGIVVNRNLNPGEYPGTRQIFTLQEVDNVYAELNAFGSQVAGITQGAPVALTSPAVPKRSFNGSVVAVLSPTSPNSSSFIVKVKIPNQGQALRPGMTVPPNVKAPALPASPCPLTPFSTTRTRR